MTDKNLFQRINEVRKAVPYIQKDAKVQTYKAVTHDMVTAKLRDHLIEYGVIVIPSLERSSVAEAGTTSKGTPIIRYEATYAITFLNMDDPKDQFAMSIEAHGNDQGDKAPAKAISMAVKYAMLKLFNLETGENEESRVEGERSAKTMTEYMKAETQEYIDNGDSLGIYLLQQQVGPDMWTEIHNSAPDGQKSKFKAKLNEMTAQGHEVLVEINQGLNEDDAHRVLENVNDITEPCKKLLARHIGPDRTKQIGKYKEQSK